MIEFMIDQYLSRSVFQFSVNLFEKLKCDEVPIILHEEK